MEPDSSNTNAQQPTTIPLSPSSGSCAAVVEPAASSASEAVAAADLSVASAESVVSAAIPVVAAIEPQNPFAANANVTTATAAASATPAPTANAAPLSPAAASAASVPLEGNSGVPIPDFRPPPTVATTAAAAPPPQQPQFYHPAPVAATTQPHPQQMPLHQLQQQQQQQHIVHPMHRRLEDDENTEPSSTNPASASLASNEARGATNAVSRFVENTRRRFGSMSNENVNGNNNNNANADGDVLDDDSGALIYGYLQKLGRNQKWQTRWFETDGECLSYYKSRKRTKLLATLDLEKVGLIAMDPEDTKEQSFTIQVLGRNYNLRADSRTVCKDWVITLNRVKEAKLQQGHIHLASPYDRVNELAPRVVVVTNRGRTRAVAETVDFDSLIAPPGSASSPTAGGTAASDAALARRSAIGTAVLARWNKRRSSLQHLSTKFTRWARSLKKYSCTDEAALLRQTSAAGSNNNNNNGANANNTNARSAANNHNNDPRLAGWINKEASRTTTILKPAPNSERSQSLASSEHDDRRYIS